MIVHRVFMNSIGCWLVAFAFVTSITTRNQKPDRPISVVRRLTRINVTGDISTLLSQMNAFSCAGMEWLWRCSVTTGTFWMETGALINASLRKIMSAVLIKARFQLASSLGRWRYPEWSSWNRSNRTLWSSPSKSVLTVYCLKTTTSRKCSSLKGPISPSTQQFTKTVSLSSRLTTQVTSCTPSSHWMSKNHTISIQLCLRRATTLSSIPAKPPSSWENPKTRPSSKTQMKGNLKSKLPITLNLTTTPSRSMRLILLLKRLSQE